MPKQVLVTGAKGQLGRSIKKLVTDDKVFSEFAFKFVGRDELDLSSFISIDKYFADKSFDYIINCAAYTAVDKAQTEQELADQINHLAVKQLAEIAKIRNIIFIHISTDYVFDGCNFRPYIESDTTNPQNIYGSSKLKGEKALSEVTPYGCILRTSWVYSEFGNNFVNTILRLGEDKNEVRVVFDQVGNPTYATDLARVILFLIQQPMESLSTFEIYHFSNEGVCSWYDFASTIFELNGTQCIVIPIETQHYPTPAKRPHFSVMNKTKIRVNFDIEIPYWRDSLSACLKILDN